MFTVIYAIYNGNEAFSMSSNFKKYTLVTKSLIDPRDLGSDFDLVEFGCLSFFEATAESAEKAAVLMAFEHLPEHHLEYEVFVFNAAGTCLLREPVSSAMQRAAISKQHDHDIFHYGIDRWPAWFFQRPELVLGVNDMTLDGCLGAVQVIKDRAEDSSLRLFSVLFDAPDQEVVVLAAAANEEDASVRAKEWYKQNINADLELNFVEASEQDVLCFKM